MAGKKRTSINLVGGSGGSGVAKSRKRKQKFISSLKSSKSKNSITKYKTRGKARR